MTKNIRNKLKYSKEEVLEYFEFIKNKLKKED